MVPKWQVTLNDITEDVDEHCAVNLFILHRTTYVFTTAHTYFEHTPGTVSRIC